MTLPLLLHFLFLHFPFLNHSFGLDRVSILPPPGSTNKYRRWLFAGNGDQETPNGHREKHRQARLPNSDGHSILFDMSHPYDASTKYLVQTRLADWLPLSGRTTTAMQVIDADSGHRHRRGGSRLRVCEEPPWLLDLELQASRDPDLLPNLPVYNVLLARRHRTLVRTVVVLLRKSADSPELTGTFQCGFRDEPPYLVFRYEVVRVWQLSPETFFSGGLGILPLTPLAPWRKPNCPA